MQEVLQRQCRQMNTLVPPVRFAREVMYSWSVFGRFCRSCLATSLRSSKWTCPYCRAYLPSEGVPATDVARRMRSERQDCAECGSLVCLSEMRAHIKTCQKYMEKYGPLQELGEMAARCVCPFCQRELDEDSLLDHCVTHHRSERRPVVRTLAAICLRRVYSPHVLGSPGDGLQLLDMLQSIVYVKVMVIL